MTRTQAEALAYLLNCKLKLDNWGSCQAEFIAGSWLTVYRVNYFGPAQLAVDSRRKAG